MALQLTEEQRNLEALWKVNTSLRQAAYLNPQNPHYFHFFLFFFINLKDQIKSIDFLYASD